MMCTTVPAIKYKRLAIGRASMQKTDFYIIFLPNRSEFFLSQSLFNIIIYDNRCLYRFLDILYSVYS